MSGEHKELGGKGMKAEGTIGIQENGRMASCHYTVKYFDEPGCFGINGGRISKLTISREGKTTCNYDRGWDMEPEDAATQAAAAILVREYN